MSIDPNVESRESADGAEYHLCILWETARSREKEILKDLASRFEIVEACEVHWSRARVSENFSRFYGQKLPPGSFKEEHCGKGPFLAVILHDRQPNYDLRLTSKGEKRVNVNTFDAKQLYREWTGGGHRIHATDSEDETRHDLALLFGESLRSLAGKYAAPWNGKISQLKADLIGAEGWKSLGEFFATLNETIPYLVMRNYEWLPDAFSTKEHGDIDLLTDSAQEMAMIANARKVFPESYRVHYAVNIAGERVLFDFRQVGDDYYDEAWEVAMLESREWNHRGFYTPAGRDYFYSLLYHALVHKPQIADDYAARLCGLAQFVGIAQLDMASLKDPATAKQLLDEYLAVNRYRYVRPRDGSVYFNQALLGAVPTRAAEQPYAAEAAPLEDGRALEERLLAAMHKAEDLSLGSPELLFHANSAAAFYHLSDARANLLRPLEANLRGKKVLELGGECGALSRYLGEIGASLTVVEGRGRQAAVARARCRDLKNVSVVDKPIDQFTSAERFDVVLLIGALAEAETLFPGPRAIAELLAFARSFLTPQGVLITALDNRLALKYWAGSPAQGGLRPFAGLQEPRQADQPVSLGRLELERALRQAAFTACEFYYPFPDFRLPGMVLSQNLCEAAPEISYNLLSQAFAPNQGQHYERLFSEGAAWRALVDNGLLGDLASAFLVVARPDDANWRVDRDSLAFTYSLGRKRPYVKEVRIEQGAQGGVVHRRLLYAKKAPAQMHMPAREPLLRGETLFTRLLPIVNRPGWSVDDLVEWLRPLYARLQQERVVVGVSEMLPGHYLDATAFNMVVDGDTASFFDLEWQQDEQIDFNYVLFRGLYQSLGRLGSVAAPAANTPLSYTDLCSQVVERLSERPAEVQRYLHLEVSFLNQVCLQQFRIAGFMRAQLQVRGTGVAAQDSHLLQAPQAGAAVVQPLLGRWLSGRLPTEVQNRQISAYLETQQGGPRFAVIILDLAGDTAAMMKTIKSLGLDHNLYATLQMVVLSVAEVPATQPGGKLHFVRIEAESHVPQLNRIVAELDAQWVMLAEAGVEFTQSGLMMMALELIAAPQCRAVYGDELQRSVEGDLGALFRPGFNLDMLLSFPSSLARNWLYRRDVLVEMGGFDPAFAGALELDMVLRLVEQDGLNGLAHIDEPMLIRDAEAPRDNPEEQTLIERHLQRRGYQASVQAVSPGIYNTDYGPVDGLGVSIIIWAGSNAERLQRCVESLLEKTRHDSYEILLVERPGADPAARTWLKGVEALADNQVRIVRSAAGNRAQAFNRVVEACRGEYLLLLSEDTAAVREDWLQAMLNHAQRDEVGIVGSKLVSPNGHVRHAGLLLGLHGVADSPFVDATLESTGYMHRLQIDQNYSAVSGDCLMIRKALYQAIGGLDEGLSEDDLADVDLCLNVRQQGYLTVWTPQSILLKDSSAARLATADEVRHKQRSAAEDLMFQRWQGLIGRDPAYNANLSLNSRSFELEPDLNLTWRPLTWRPLPVVLGHPADPYGCGNYRVIKPFVALRNAGMVDGMLSPGLLHVADLERYAPDVILLQRQISEVRLQAMRRIKLLSSAFKVYELDDYLPNLPLKSVHRKDMPKDAVKALRRGMGFVDRFVVSTHALAEAFQGLHEDIRVVENRLPLEWWEGLGSQRRRGRKPRVGWAGGVSHTGDLELIADVVKALVDEVEWVFFGMCPEKIRPYVHEVHGGVDIDLYPQKLASLDLDLALAPLEDNRFNHCKSNLRLLEYGICGFPVVCSDLTPYRGDLPVTRVKNRYKDWVDAIRAHLADMDATARMGDELQSRVRAEWMLEGRNLELWRAAWLPDA